LLQPQRGQLMPGGGEFGGVGFFMLISFFGGR
jgi:hypothetical protein